MDWLVDSVHTIRVEAVKTILMLKNEKFGIKWMENLVGEKLGELCTNQKFNLRIHTIHMVNVLHSEISDQFLNDVYK